MPLTLEQYVTYLDSQNTPWPAPPEVVAPRARPCLLRLPGIRVVLWNIYGTLLNISGGELVFELSNKFLMDVALDKTIQEFNMWSSMTRKGGQPADYLKQVYREVLEDQAVRLSPPPEIPSEKVWEAILKKLLQKDYKFDAGFFGALNEYSSKIAYFFHASLQGTAAYAGAAATLRQVAEAGIVQGFLADGQCFTLPQLQRGLRQQDPDADLSAWVDPSLCLLSHQVGTRKPGEALFRQLQKVLEENDVAPDEVLHVGSRVTQDLIPAKKLGLRTALFAGDAASIQATREQLKAAVSRPEVLLTSLEQLTEIIPVS
jgi:hypothetical protein